MRPTHNIQLWSGPRNISTALMYSFAQRKDTTVWDEPLYANYLLRTGIDHPGREETLREHEPDSEKVIQEMLEGEWGTPVLFNKQMGHHLTGLRTDWLKDTINIFLIRHPGEVINSFSKVIEKPDLQDIGIKDQWELFRQLREKGHDPVVMDGNEILKNPRGILSAACRQMGIPFDPAMLSWQAGARPEDGVWAQYWYSNVHKSTGFAPYIEKSREVRSDLQPLLEEALPYYQQLIPYAL